MPNTNGGSLIKATVRGWQYLCLCRDGSALTLCGRIGTYPHRWQPNRDLCPDCAHVAGRDRLSIPC